MELVLTAEDLEPLPEPQGHFITKPSGFLNSEYKRVVNESLKNTSSKSIFGIKQRLKSAQYQVQSSSIETVLKVSIFVTFITRIFS